ncbi:hypothetical protein JST97_21760 [bacterium]|nr:hypothetical protein [bacterium]
MQIPKSFEPFKQRGDWAPDAVLAPVPGTQSVQPSDTVRFFGVELPAAQLIPAPHHRPATSQGSGVWAPDAVPAPPPGYTPEPSETKGTVSFFGAELPAHLLFPQQDSSPAQATPQTSVWAPDAVLAPPPGYKGEPEPTQVSYFGARLSFHPGFVD